MRSGCDIKISNGYRLKFSIMKARIFQNNIRKFMAKMTTEEAFVKVLQMHGIEHAYGIIGSAFMPISDIFPDAGITFWDVAHETNGGLIADGYTRATGKNVYGYCTKRSRNYWISYSN
jgi:hypothetical protein